MPLTRPGPLSAALPLTPAGATVGAIGTSAARGRVSASIQCASHWQGSGADVAGFPVHCTKEQCKHRVYPYGMMASSTENNHCQPPQTSSRTMYHPSPSLPDVTTRTATRSNEHHSIPSPLPSIEGFKAPARQAARFVTTAQKAPNKPFDLMLFLSRVIDF